MDEKVYDTESWIAKAEMIWEYEYYYGDFTVYTKGREPIKIGCYKHGIVSVYAATKHIVKNDPHGCPKCGKEASINTRFKGFSKKEYINKAKENWPNKNYDYTNIDYINMHGTIIIYCTDHKKDFITNAWNHTQNKHFSGCPDCDYDAWNDRMRVIPFKEIEERSNEIHNNKYKYFKNTYFGTHKKMDIECSVHGIFSQTPYVHIHKTCGCPKCNFSKGELKIANYFESRKIHYISQFKINRSIWDENNPYILGIDHQSEFDKQIKNKLFDFYVPIFNILIEYDGKQHFESVEHFGGEEGFKIRQERDKIKDDYCIANDLKLLRIPYTEFENIEKILDQLFS